MPVFFRRQTFVKDSPGSKTIPSGTVTSSINSALFIQDAVLFCSSCMHCEIQICRMSANRSPVSCVSLISAPKQDTAERNRQIKTVTKAIFFISRFLSFAENTKMQRDRFPCGTRCQKRRSVFNVTKGVTVPGKRGIVFLSSREAAASSFPSGLQKGFYHSPAPGISGEIPASSH